jgi:hypothetical protein
LIAKEFIPPAYEAWRPGTTSTSLPFPIRFQAPKDCSKIPSQSS